MMTMHNVILCILLVWYAIVVLICVATIGRPREPLKPSDAVGTIVVVVLTVWGILYLAGGFA